MKDPVIEWYRCISCTRLISRARLMVNKGCPKCGSRNIRDTKTSCIDRLLAKVFRR